MSIKGEPKLIKQEQDINLRKEKNKRGKNSEIYCDGFLNRLFKLLHTKYKFE